MILHSGPHGLLLDPSQSDLPGLYVQESSVAALSTWRMALQNQTIKTVCRIAEQMLQKCACLVNNVCVCFEIVTEKRLCQERCLY